MWREAEAEAAAGNEAGVSLTDETDGLDDSDLEAESALLDYDDDDDDEGK